MINGLQWFTIGLEKVFLPKTYEQSKVNINMRIIWIGNRADDADVVAHVLNQLLTSLVTRIGSLLWLWLGLVVALGLGRVSSSSWCSSILGLTCSWVLWLLSWLRWLGPSWTLGSHLTLNCFSLLHLANAAVVLRPLCRVVWPPTTTWLRSCCCRSWCCRRAGSRWSWV